MEEKSYFHLGLLGFRVESSLLQSDLQKGHSSILSNKKNQGISKISKYLDVAINVLENKELYYSDEHKWILLLRVLSTLCELPNQESPSPIFSKDVLDLLISITHLLTPKPGNNLNKPNQPRLDLIWMKTHLKALKMLLDAGNATNTVLPADTFRRSRSLSMLKGEDKDKIYDEIECVKKKLVKIFFEFESTNKYVDTFTASSVNIYLANGIFKFYEMIINKINDNIITAATKEVLERTHQFIADGSSSLSKLGLFKYSNYSEVMYKDMCINDNILIISWDDILNTKVTIVPESLEAVTTACNAIKQYSKESGKKICSFPSNMRTFEGDYDECVKHFINFGRYCEMLSYFRKSRNRLIFEGYLQTIIYSLIKVEEFLKCENSYFIESDFKNLRNEIFNLADDLKDNNIIPVEHIYAKNALEYIHLHKEPLCNCIAKFSQSSKNNRDNTDKVHPILNISKNTYDEAKNCGELYSFITKLTEGADFEVRKIAPENFYANVSNKVYAASIFLQFAVMEKDAGRDMVQKLLRLDADPRVENLQDGMSAIGIALLYEDFAEEFLREITKRKYHLTETKIDITKCLISSDLRFIDEYSNNEILMSSLKQLYYST